MKINKEENDENTTDKKLIKKEREFKRKYVYGALSIFVAAACSVLFVYILFRSQEIKGAAGNIMGIIRPFIIGAAVAYILRPLCNTIETTLLRLVGKVKHGSFLVEPAKMASVFLSVLFAILALYILAALVLPQLVVSIVNITQRIPIYVNIVTEWTEKIFAENEVAANWVSSISENVLEKFQDWARKDLIPQLGNMVGGVSSGVKNIVAFVFNFLIGIIVSIYFLAGRKKMAAQGKLVIYSIFQKKWANAIYEELKFTDKVFSGFISGKLLDSTIIGIITFIALSFMKCPYTMLVSVLVGVTNVIPFFGPYIGMVPSTFLIVTADPMKALYFLIFIIILQQIDGNVIGPKILGNSTGISGFWVLFSITVFSGLFGFVGMLIGVPVFAVIYDIIKKLVKYGITRHENEDILEEYNKKF